MNNWHTREISELVLESGTDITHGRNSASSDFKRKKNNKIFLLPSTDPMSIVKSMASDASLMLLFVAFVIELLLGRSVDGLPGILLIACFFICASYLKYRSSLRITNAYRLLLPEVKIVENGINKRLSVYDVEVNDLIAFSQGDIISADARLVSSSNLIVAERAVNEITGKSEYIRLEKDHSCICEEDEIHCRNMVYAGSLVISGNGSAIVTAIGTDTVICKQHSGISIVPENDKPVFLQSFLSKCRRLSLVILLTVIPVCFLAMYLHSHIAKADIDLLSLFTLTLTLAATSMSELSISAGEAIITKELLPSSIVSKSEKKQASKITKLSSAEALADVDTFLVLTPEALIDQRLLVRRIYFSGEQFRSDSLHSEQVKYFVKQIDPYFSHMSQASFKNDDRIIADYLSGFGNISIDNSRRSKFLRNFPIKGARACVFGFNNDGIPNEYIAAVSDISFLDVCDRFRTEGGGEWQLGAEDIKKITSFFESHAASTSFKPIAFYSCSSDSSKPIFEGIICIGEEFVYSDGELLDDLTEAGIHPILVLEEENKRNVEIAYNCGLIKSHSDIAICSEYSRAGLTVSDAHLSTRVFVGFGRKGTQAIAKRLAANSKNVLPIIKDSANRHDILPHSIYATHSPGSLDSVKIASSVSLIPNNTEKKNGGLSDALKLVQSSSMAFLKLGIYKNYLVFSSFLRIFTVCIPLLWGYSLDTFSSVALLVCGFLCDFAALISIAYSVGIPVKARNVISETRKLFYLSTSCICVFCSLIVSVAILIAGVYLIKTNTLSVKDLSILVPISLIVAQIASIGGFLLILHGRTRRHRFNICYFAFAVSATIFLLCFSFVPQFAVFLGATSANRAIMPYILALAVISAACVGIFIGKLSSYSLSKRL